MLICNQRMNIVCNVTGFYRIRENEAMSIRRIGVLLTLARAREG